MMKRMITAAAMFFIPLMVMGQLYVGANYHPHDDKDIEKISQDVRLMKEAGFTCVRMGHLAWDSYEPQEGVYDFEWFDTVMDLMHEAGIGVILDIPTRPAPLWLHAKYPSIDIVDENGNRQYPNHRYMEDVGDPHFQEHALRFVREMAERYASHPALMAFGVDNEPGDGPISYSESVRLRFVEWLKDKYNDLDTLNEAWDGQRWSRKVGEWNEIGLPLPWQGAPERKLDFRRFISDEVSGFYFSFLNVLKEVAPDVLTNTNAWYYSTKKYFDYVPLAYSGLMTRNGFGFYPGNSLKTSWGIWDNVFGITRVQFEAETPFWCSEFTTMTAVPGSIRKAAYSTLFYGNQLVCGWTWQSMHGGEEQYLEGMLDWDGIPNRKYHEYKQIAEEFAKIEDYFPYKLKAEVGLAYSFDSQMASAAFPEDHQQQIQKVFDQFIVRNMDCRMISIPHSGMDYKLVILPGLAVMDEETAGKIRDYVRDGGCVLMTSNSAVVDNTGKVFGSTHPGMLADVFGIRVASYEETSVMNEISLDGYKDNRLRIDWNGRNVDVESARYDVMYPQTADVLATVSSLPGNSPILTCNEYGKGKAYYLGLPSGCGIMGDLLDALGTQLDISKGPDVPYGVMARDIDDTHSLYLNTTEEEQVIRIGGKAEGLISGKKFKDEFVLSPFEAEFVKKR